MKKVIISLMVLTLMNCCGETSANDIPLEYGDVLCIKGTDWQVFVRYPRHQETQVIFSTGEYVYVRNTHLVPCTSNSIDG